MEPEGGEPPAFHVLSVGALLPTRSQRNGTGICQDPGKNGGGTHKIRGKEAENIYTYCY